MKVKYPRTFHLPSSPGATSDDKILKTFEQFIGKTVVITEKMDGENTTIYANGYTHARSLDSKTHPSRNWLKSVIVPIVMTSLPENYRLCGENLYAQHSIKYTNLLSYFYAFSLWNSQTCLSWAETYDYCALNNITTVPVLYQGVFDNNVIENIINQLDITKQEGFVVRLADEFDYQDFNKCVAKYVRPGHVTSDTHWAYQEIKPNGLKK